MPLAASYPSPFEQKELHITPPPSSFSPVSRWVPDGWISEEKYRDDIYSHYQEHGKKAWETIKKLHRSLDDGQSEQCIISIINELDSFQSIWESDTSGRVFSDFAQILDDFPKIKTEFICLFDHVYERLNNGCFDKDFMEYTLKELTRLFMPMPMENEACDKIYTKIGRFQSALDQPAVNEQVARDSIDKFLLDIKTYIMK